jgi:endogenous inhibitor of DNA gyrase (YacG/DUF329 family)
MAAWGFDCPNCNKQFAQFSIKDSPESHYPPTKPVFPEGGIEIECPSCGHKAVYQKNDLTYLGWAKHKTA